MRSATEKSRASRTDRLDLSVLERSAAFDRLIAVARCAAAGFYIIASIVEPGDDLFLSVIIGIALVLGSILGVSAPRDWTNRKSFGLTSIVFDGMIITLLLANSLDNPFEVGYTSAFFIVFEGAKWGRRGGTLAGVWMGATVGVWTGAVNAQNGVDFNAESMVQRFGLFVILGWAIGTMIHNLNEQRSAIQTLVDSSHDGMLTITPAGVILSGNESAELILDLPADQLVGSVFNDLFVVGSKGETALDALRRGGASELEVAAEPRRWVEAMLTDAVELGYSFVVCRDVTKRATNAQRLAHDASHDELTQLGNRRRLMQELSAALDPKRSGQTVSLLLIDLDDFKRVNDTLGHLVGDELLVALAGRLARLVRPTDVAVRLGGDEFAVMMRGTQGAEPARALAARVGAILAQPVQIGAASASVTASIGFAVGSSQTTTIDEMLHDADVALYAAKGQGKSIAVAHRPGLAEIFLDGRALAEDLAAALAGGPGLSVVYQPIFSLDQPRRLVAAEALCRWTHPVHGVMVPETFVAAAEKSGRSVELDRFVRRRAMTEIASVDADHRLELHVNLSAASIDDPDLLHTLLEDVATTDFNLSRLVLEITEAVTIEKTPKLIESLNRLRELGARIALDDFGTGHSSLESLRWIPLDMLKIDRELVHGLSSDAERDIALVDTIVKLGASMDFEIVAAGIETEAELASLVRAGCQFGQGYLLGKPNEIAQLADLLTVDRSTPHVIV